MARYAQTILQLHGELEDAGWNDDERARMARAYRLAADLFSGQTRGSGKPFVAHLVGTASILAAHRADPVAAVAGLLHAAYELGDFGDGGDGATPKRRSELATIAGADVEAHVHAYWALRWSEATIAALPGALHSLAPLDRNVLWMRLANELDDHLDLGIRFCRNARERLERLERRAEATVAIATALGATALARELADAYRECRTREVPAALIGPSGWASLQVPRSCSPRVAPRLRRRIAAWLRR